VIERERERESDREKEREKERERERESCAMSAIRSKRLKGVVVAVSNSWSLRRTNEADLLNHESNQ
jgi:hypothetical protein